MNPLKGKEFSEVADKFVHPEPRLADAEAFVSKVFGMNQNLMRNVFLTGSVAFGEAGEGSDIDLVFPIMSREGVEERLAFAEIKLEPSFYNSGVHADVDIEGKPARVNFLFLHPLDYVVWYRAGEIYKTLPRQNDRNKRHAIFESIRAMVKTSFAVADIFVDGTNCRQLRTTVFEPTRKPESAPADLLDNVKKQYAAAEPPF